MPLSRGREKLLGRLRSRRQREREGLVLVEGPHAIGVALAVGARFRFALVADDAADPRELRAAGVEVEVVPASTLASLADTETPQGWLAVVEEPGATLDDVRLPGLPASAHHGDGGAPLLVLDRIQDPGNAGTLIRSAAAFGAPGVVVLDGTVDPWNPKVVRASAGEAFRLPVVRSTWEAFEGWRLEQGVHLFVADAGGEDVRRLLAASELPEKPGRATGSGGSPPVPPRVPPPASPRALLIGNEGAGPRPEARATSGTILALPLAPGVESLNAAMAGSILLWALGPGADSSAGFTHRSAPPSQT